VVLLETVKENFTINFPGCNSKHNMHPYTYSSGSLLDKKPIKKCVLKEKMDKIGARLEIHHKSLRHLAQETANSKSSAAKATLFTFWPYKIRFQKLLMKNSFA
jgi:hypothetical protein